MLVGWSRTRSDSSVVVVKVVVSCSFSPSLKPCREMAPSRAKGREVGTGKERLGVEERLGPAEVAEAAGSTDMAAGTAAGVVLLREEPEAEAEAEADVRWTGGMVRAGLKPLEELVMEDSRGILLRPSLLFMLLLLLLALLAP